VPPPEFADPARAPTGSTDLEERILEAIQFQEAGDADLARWKREAEAEMAGDPAVNAWVSALLGRGRLQDALNYLQQRAFDALEDESKEADALGLAMGQQQWEVCAKMAHDYLVQRKSSGGFLVRALCTARSGDLVAAEENVLAADAVNPMEPDLRERFLGLLRQRSAPHGLPPGDAALYEDLMMQASRRSALDRLFVQHLLGRYDAQIAVGSVDFWGVSDEDVRAVVLSRARSYRHCWALANHGSKGKGRLAGKAETQWIIGRAGEVSDAKIVSSDWGGHPHGADMDRCLVEQIQRLRFPRPRFGYPQLAQHRFSYQPD
jgi:hypothetical protein